MTVARQLHQLQEVDLQLSANERAQTKARGQIGESQRVLQLKEQLSVERKRLEDLQHQQHSAEWQADDLAAKLKGVEEKLFGGKVRNPKELANFQREADEIKARLGQAEDRTLDVMGQVEAATKGVSTMVADLERLEADWRSQQKQLVDELEQLAEARGSLTGERQLLASEIAHEAVRAYEDIRSRKGTGVARVEQGTCRGCQIALPTMELQQVRGGGLVRCGSCGRILFLP